MKRLSAFAAFLVLGAALALYALMPGYHRVLTPGLFGATRAAPGLYTDAPERAAEFQGLIAQAMVQSSDLFHTTSMKPRVILCTTTACADQFGLKVRAVTLGQRTVLLSPGGINPTIMLHEQVHVDLRQHMGLRDLWNPRFPAWFDEGLASHASADPRLTDYSVADARWILQMRTRGDWAEVNRDGGWRDSYGAAKTLVGAIEEEIGRDGLRAVISETAHTRDLTGALRARMGADWP